MRVNKVAQVDKKESECPIFKERFGYVTPISFITKMKIGEDFIEDFQDDWEELGEPNVPKRLRRKHRKFIKYLDALKEDATDEYSSRVEIKFIDDVLGYGLFAKEDIPAKSVICNYIGELVLHEEADDHGYLFGFSDTDFEDWVIDPREHGNYAQFMNHASVDLDTNNVEVDYFFWEGMPHVFFMTDQKVNKGEQLLYDYGDEYWEDMKIKPV